LLFLFCRYTFTKEAWGDGGTPFIRLRLAGELSVCLSRRVDSGDAVPVTFHACSDTVRQQWVFSPKGGEEGEEGDGERFGTIGAPTGGCLDNMQRERGPFGLYGCHDGGTQQWSLSMNGSSGTIKIKSKEKSDTCLGPDPFVDQWICTANDLNMLWDWRPISSGGRGGAGTKPVVHLLSSRVDRTLCLHRAAHGPAHSAEEAATHLKLTKCDATVQEQQWELDAVDG
jgi:hypothetical protein